MRPCSRINRDVARALFTLAIVVVAAAHTSGCGGPLVLSLLLKPGLNDATQTTFDTSSLQSLFVILTTSDGKIDTHAIPLDATKAVPITPGNGVDKLKPLSVEVRGCESATCERNSDVRFRGCHPPVDLAPHNAADGEVPVEIEMFPLGDAHIEPPRCPAFDPRG